MNISSTRVRSILATQSPNQLFAQLSGMVLNPALLLQILGYGKHVPKNAVVERRVIKARERRKSIWYAGEEISTREYGYGYWGTVGWWVYLRAGLHGEPKYLVYIKHKIIDRAFYIIICAIRRWRR